MERFQESMSEFQERVTIQLQSDNNVQLDMPKASDTSLKNLQDIFSNRIEHLEQQSAQTFIALDKLAASVQPQQSKRQKKSHL